MPGELHRLRSRLQLALAGDAAESWGEGMATALDQVRRHHDAATMRAVGADTIAAAIGAYRKSGRLERFVDLKYVCLGVATPDADGDCLLAAARLRDQLLASAQSLAEPRRQMKCFQALLRSYWSFPLHGDGVSAAAREGFAVLRAWLARRYSELERVRMTKPEWFTMLSMHQNLLGDHPCERYGPALLAGRGAALQLAIDDLAIPSGSWVLEEAVLALMQAATQLGDAEFRARLPQLLALGLGQAGLTLAAKLSRRAIACLLWRYARCAELIEHLPLFDAALALLGDPNLQRPAWDAQVTDERGAADDLAREMVGSWLKQRLIRDFFQRLARQGSSQQRRLDYWLRYEPFIEDMWFALGTADQVRAGRGYEDFRRYAGARLIELQDAGAASTSLLALRINEFLLIEAGDADRPLQLIRRAALTPEQARLFAGGEASVSSASFAALPVEVELEHRDGAGATWEQRFDAYLRPIVWRAQ